MLRAEWTASETLALQSLNYAQALDKLSAEKQKEIYERIEKTIEKYNLRTSGDTFAQTFAYPLFEKEIGCLVHSAGKPAPCIQHACYENKSDLPLPIWLSLINPFLKNKE